MSIGIYAFLSIYFLVFGVSDFAQFRTHCASRPAPCAATIYPTRRVQRPGVCGLPCIWYGLRCCLPLAVCPGALGLWPPPAGHIAAARHRPVSPVTTEKIKKAQKITPTPIANLQNFPQKQKDPYKGSVFCAILALQALKGRNLQ